MKIANESKSTSLKHLKEKTVGELTEYIRGFFKLLADRVKDYCEQFCNSEVEKDQVLILLLNVIHQVLNESVEG
jgi:hypothetical protein